ncbi:MAG: hypothetical protein H6599_02410 [Flavobacteriales bacterium]|nr:hypothetical protein [Flavobacteriales bacterium]
MNKILLTLSIMALSLVSYAETIEEQANKAAKEAYSSAMIRNILIIAGFAAVYFIYKLVTKKND